MNATWPNSNKNNTLKYQHYLGQHILKLFKDLKDFSLQPPCNFGIKLQVCFCLQYKTFAGEKKQVCDGPLLVDCSFINVDMKTFVFLIFIKATEKLSFNQMFDL